MTRGSLFGLFHGLAGVTAAGPSRGLPMRRIRRLLNYDVVLNVELVMDIYDVDLNTLSRVAFIRAWCMLAGRLGLARTSFHICWNNSLNVEELLVVVTVVVRSPAFFLVLPYVAPTTTTVGLLLNLLSGMSCNSAATSCSTTTHGL